jgi:hypothetical protein
VRGQRNTGRLSDALPACRSHPGRWERGLRTCRDCSNCLRSSSAPVSWRSVSAATHSSAAARACTSSVLGAPARAGRQRRQATLQAHIKIPGGPTMRAGAVRHEHSHQRRWSPSRCPAPQAAAPLLLWPPLSGKTAASLAAPQRGPKMCTRVRSKTKNGIEVVAATHSRPPPLHTSPRDAYAVTTAAHPYGY